MDESGFPANSRTTPKRVGPVEEPRKVEKVVTGDVKRRKPPLGKRLKAMFIGSDARSVGGYILVEVLVPAVKDLLHDLVTQSIDRTLYGDGSSRRSSSRSSGGSSNYTPYNRYSSAPWRPGQPETRQMSRQARASHNFDEIVLATRGEAETVVEGLFSLVSQYQQATVHDLYEMVGAETSHTDQKWGWTDMRGSQVLRVRDGYLLRLPQPEPLD